MYLQYGKGTIYSFRHVKICLYTLPISKMYFSPSIWPFKRPCQQTVIHVRLTVVLHVSCCDNVNADCLHIRHLLVCFADIYILSITKHPSVLDIAWCINSHVVFKTNCAYRFTLPWFFKELSTQIKDNGGNRHINYIVKNLKDHSIFWYKDVINLCTCKVFFRAECFIDSVLMSR